jgi:hypothetical protein
MLVVVGAAREPLVEGASEARQERVPGEETLVDGDLGAGSASEEGDQHTGALADDAQLPGIILEVKGEGGAATASCGQVRGGVGQVPEERGDVIFPHPGGEVHPIDDEVKDALLEATCAGLLGAAEEDLEARHLACGM